MEAARNWLDDQVSELSPIFSDDAFSRLDGLDVCRVDLSDAAEISAGCDLLLSVPREGPLAVLGPRLDDGMTAVIRLGVGHEDCDLDAMTRKAIAPDHRVLTGSQQVGRDRQVRRRRHAVPDVG